MNGQFILGTRPLGADGIGDEIAVTHRSGDAPYVYRNFERVRPASREEIAALPMVHHWGYGVIRLLAEHVCRSGGRAAPRDPLRACITSDPYSQTQARSNMMHVVEPSEQTEPLRRISISGATRSGYDRCPVCGSGFGPRMHRPGCDFVRKRATGMSIALGIPALVGLGLLGGAATVIPLVVIVSVGFWWNVHRANTTESDSPTAS